MSGKTMSMSFRINAALSNGFDKTFNKAGGSVASLGQKLNQYNRSAAKIEKILQLRKETKVLGDEYAAQKEKLDRLTRAVIDAKRPSESLIAQQQRAEKAVAKTKMAIVNQREALQRLSREMRAGGASTEELMRRHQKYTVLAEGRAQKARGIDFVGAGKNAAAGIGLWAATKVPAKIGNAITVGADFQRSMSRTAAVMPGLTEADRAALKAQAQTLGATTAMSATQVAAGQRAYAMGGFKTQEILAAMPDTLQLALAAEKDLGEAAKINSIILKGFGLGADKTGYVADVLTNAFTSGFLDLQYLADAAKIAGSSANKARLSLGEFSAMVVALADTGASGSEAGTSTRNVISRLTAPTDNGQKIFSALGIKIADANGKVRHPIALLNELDQKIKAYRLSEVEVNKLFRMVFEEATAPHAYALMKSVAEGAIQKNAVAFNERGTNDRVAAIQSDNLSGDMTNLSSAVEGLSIAIFDSMEKDIRPLVQVATKIVSFGTKLAADFPAVTEGVTILAGASGIAAAFKILEKIASVFGLGSAASVAGRVAGATTAAAPLVAVAVVGKAVVDTAISRNAADYEKNKASAIEDVQRLANGATEDELIYGEVPGMASGGIVTGPTLAMVGEGRESEAVLPLSKLGGMIGQGMTVNFSPVINLTGSGGDAYDDIKRGLEDGTANLKRELERLMNDQRRLSFA